MTVLSCIVVKAGTNVLTTSEGKLDREIMQHLAQQIADIRRQYHTTVVLVSSGAITCGAEALHLTPKNIAERQAAAAVGQSKLMQEYTELFSPLGIQVAQFLVTKDGLSHSVYRENIITTMNTLFHHHDVLPIVNENDCVATDEIGEKFGDNDELSSLMAILLDAKKLIILSDIDGVFTDNPKLNPDAKRISVLNGVSDREFKWVQDMKNQRSRGGMQSKLNSAKLACEAGIEVVIGNGKQRGVLLDIMAGKDVGTRVVRGHIEGNSSSNSKNS